MSAARMESPVMSVEQLLQEIRQHPEDVSFDDVIATIKENYQYTPTSFSNGLEKNTLTNAAGQNEGSCRIFAFAHLHGLSEGETLSCFGRFYREDVLQNPDGEDHSNIRNFMRDGWAGIVFDGEVLRRC